MLHLLLQAVVAALHLEEQRLRADPAQRVGADMADELVDGEGPRRAKINPGLRHGYAVVKVSRARAPRHPHGVTAMLVAPIQPLRPVQCQEPRLCHPLRGGAGEEGLPYLARGHRPQAGYGLCDLLVSQGQHRAPGPFGR